MYPVYFFSVTFALNLFGLVVNFFALTSATRQPRPGPLMNYSGSFIMPGLPLTYETLIRCEEIIFSPLYPVYGVDEAVNLSRKGVYVNYNYLTATREQSRGATTTTLFPLPPSILVGARFGSDTSKTQRGGTRGRTLNELEIPIEISITHRNKSTSRPRYFVTTAHC